MRGYVRFFGVIIACIAIIGALTPNADARRRKPRVFVDDVTVTEGIDPVATFTVSLSRASRRTVNVDYSTSAPTDFPGPDFSAVAGTLEFLRGEQTKTVEVPIIDDSIDEPVNAFQLLLQNPNGLRLGDGIGEATIIDDDPLPIFSVAPATGPEGDPESPQELAFLVTVTNGTECDLSVSLTTQSDEAIGGEDFEEFTVVVHWTDGGDAPVTIFVPIIADEDKEKDEDFSVVLHDASCATIGPQGSAIGTIENDD